MRNTSGVYGCIICALMDATTYRFDDTLVIRARRSIGQRPASGRKRATRGGRRGTRIESDVGKSQGRHGGTASGSDSCRDLSPDKTGTLHAGKSS